MPKIAWFILVLGVVWFLLRRWLAHLDGRRQQAYDDRMAALMAEREAYLDAHKEQKIAPIQAATMTVERVKIRCLGCRELNDESRKTCQACGLEL